MAGHRSTLRLGRLAGVPIGVQPLWLVIVALLTWALGRDWFPDQAPGIDPAAAYALGLLSALGIFAGILLHELGHAVVARRRGVQVDEIDLWLLGGVARMHGEPAKPGDELRFALAGPAVTLAIAAVFGAVRLAVGGVAPDWVLALIDYQLFVNGAILAFNLLPAFPLDGGRVARALLWRRLGDKERATAAAATGGRAFGVFLLVLGTLSFLSGAVGGLWLALVGGFLVVAAGAEEQGSRVARSFAGRTAGDVMTAPAATLPADLTLEQCVVRGFARHLYASFPVVGDDGRVTGLLLLRDVRAVPPARRGVLRADDVAVRDAALLVAADTPVADLLARPAFRRAGRAVVVAGDGSALGIVSRTDLDRRLRAEDLLPDLHAPRAAA